MRVDDWLEMPLAFYEWRLKDFEKFHRNPHIRIEDRLWANMRIEQTKKKIEEIKSRGV